tara:strand:+ start:2805 stop:4307 length:1503 start_codon:yes stop_codon:yes gene_type:complete
MSSKNNNIWDRIFIIPGAQEVIKMIDTRPEAENVSARPNLSNDDKYAFELGGKLKYEGICTGDNDKMKENLDICTYGNTLTFFGPAVYNMTFERFWLGNKKDVDSGEEKILHIGFIGFINEQLKKLPDAEQVNFFLGTHHNRLKQTIFEGILNKEQKKNFANCCCIKMSKESGQWEIKFVFEGFPDQPDKPYFSNTGTPWRQSTEGMNDPKPLIDFLSKIERDNVNIYIIRHGNAFHNKPLRLVKSAGLDRPLDSCLTPLGIIQADMLGKDLQKEGHLNSKGINVWCSSYMNRALLTVSQLIPYSDTKYQRLEQFRNFLVKHSLAQLYSRLVKENGGDLTNWKTNIDKLVNSQAATGINDLTKEMDKYMKPGGIYFPQTYFKTVSDFKIANIKEVIFPAKGIANSDSLKVDFVFGIGNTSGGKKKKTRKRKKLMCPKNCCGDSVIKCGCPESCPHCNCQEIKRLRKLLRKKTKKRKKKKRTKKKARKRRRRRRRRKTIKK